jgi:hypothetical protein
VGGDGHGERKKTMEKGELLLFLHTGGAGVLLFGFFASKQGEDSLSCVVSDCS